MRRRTLLRYLGRLAVLGAGVAVGGVVLRQAAQPGGTALPGGGAVSRAGLGILRPPGALPEAEFLDRCIQCFRCAAVCPPKAIRFRPVGGRLQAYVPVVVPSQRGCILCMNCTEVCPTGALTPLDPERDHRVKERVGMGTAEIDERTCITHLGLGKCESCYTICPVRGDAITQAPGTLEPEVDPEACVGCGLCEEVCPVESKAIRVRPLAGRKPPSEWSPLSPPDREEERWSPPAGENPWG